MELSSLLLAGLALLLLAAGIASAVLKFTRPKLLMDLSPSLGDLSVPTTVGYPTQTRDGFLIPAGATFMVYLNCVVQNRTPSLQAANRVVPFRIGNTLQLQLVDGTSQSPPKTVLAIQTQSPQGAIIEEIPLESFPQQKWVHLAIVREGRRYTVYYNGKVVGSSRTQYYPTINSSQLSFGSNSMLRGESIGPKVIPTAVREDELRAELGETSDTRHEPYRPIDWSAMFPTLGCPGGIFCASVSTAEAVNPLKQWSSPYA